VTLALFINVLIIIIIIIIISRGKNGKTSYLQNSAFFCRF